MEVYNQLKQRIKRDHGRSFDQLVRAGREQVAQLRREKSSPNCRK
jgi:hypothetical protein